MRILHLDSGREMRGGQWQVLRLHRGLLTAGHESHLLARAGSPLLQMAREQGLPAEPLPLLLPSRRFDLIHAHDARSHTLSTLTRTPLVVSRRVAFPVKTTALSRWKYSRPALFLAVSRFVAQELRKAGVPASRIEIVYDGIPVPAREADGDAILAPWTLDPAKGLALAQQAAALAKVPLEFSKDLEADLPRARALLYLSHSEGLGSGILLAMAHGVPVIASNIGGIPELIQDGVNGLLVQNEPESVAAAFSRLHRQLGHAARQTVLERFTVDHMVQSTLAAYARVLNA
jgi:glycosyltransferase involved in cell wall biosynthesis